MFNRAVVFSTTDSSYHGHPDPLTCPEGRARYSIAMYYYTVGRPADEVSADHSTLFVERPGENLNDSFLQRVGGVRGLVKLFVPPILTRSGRGGRPEA